MVNISKTQNAKDGTWMRKEGNKRKTTEEQEESVQRKTVKL